MTNYRRNRVPGGTYFFAVSLHDRQRAPLVQHIDILREAICGVKMNPPARWQASKTVFSKRMPQGESRSASRLGKADRGVRQRRFWEHTIGDDRYCATYMDDIHFSPVKHELLAELVAWPYSSFHRAVKMWAYPTGWADREVTLNDVGASWA